MYTRPETRGAEARLWAAMRRFRWEGVDAAPEDLATPFDLWRFWTSPDLIFGQTCALPYRLMDNPPTVLGASIHPLDVPAGHYRSMIVTRADDTRSAEGLSHAPLAFNDARSQSGWGAAWDAGLGRGPVMATGSHRASAAAIARGHAEVAAIDIVTWELLTRWEPGLTDQLRVVAPTRPYPALPFITRIPDTEGLGRALRRAVSELSAEDKDTLLISGIADMTASDYLSLPNPPPPQI